MVITSKIKLDLACRTSSPARVDAVQDDKYSRNVEISMFANNVAWNPPGTSTVIVHYQKADNTSGHYDTLPNGDAAGSIKDNTILIRLAPQVCTASGAVKAAIGLVCNGVELHTFPFIINVHPCPGANFVSEDYTNVGDYVHTSGWDPDCVLVTDANGNVTTIPKNDFSVNDDDSGTGMTDEERAQQTQNTQDIAAIQEEIDASPVTVSEDGYTDIAGQRKAASIRFTRTDTEIAVDVTMQGGIAYNGVMTLDENGFPVKYSEDDLEIDMGFTGFDDLLTTVWEGGSY